MFMQPERKAEHKTAAAIEFNVIFIACHPSVQEYLDRLLF